MGHQAAGLLALLVMSVTAGSAAQPWRSAPAPDGGQVFLTDYARLKLDATGFVTSLTARRSGHEYVPAGRPSPLLSLHEGGALVPPRAALFDAPARRIVLTFANGAVAVVLASEAATHWRFQLVSLAPRGQVDNVVWGPLHTTISKTIGDIIGVVRDDAWAIGMMGLDDNTITGPPTDGDCAGMGCYVHSPDPRRYPVPPQYKEGQWFNIGGDGVSDVAFFSHPEEYFQMVFGNGAKLEPEFGSTITYYARDRRRSYTHLFSLLPGFPASRPRHQTSDPVDVDFIGSGIALYACPDDQGLATIGRIQLAEGLPHPVSDGKWLRDPTGLRADIAWYGPHDKLIEYADALGLKAVQDEGQGEYYANPADHWQGPRVGFADGRRLTYREFCDQTNAHGIKYGLHTLCLFLQGGRCTDVTPVPSEHLQTVLRTKLARDISAADTQITVTDPSWLAEDGTWPMRDGSNYLRIGGELLRYSGISDSAPWTLKGVVRGHATTAAPHRAGDELVKLQVNCYNGFCPDMVLMLDYADYYAKVLAENGMEYIDFDGLESTVYQNHGYYGVRTFLRRLFDSYGRLTGGKVLRVMGSAVFAGGWEYMGVCNVGGGNNMFDPILNRWGIEGKDIRYGFANSYFPPTFGIQDYHSDWSVYDAENLQAKAIGFGAIYMLGLSQAAVERSGEKEAIFRAFRTWEQARAAGGFTPSLREQLGDLGRKFHLEQTGPQRYALTAITETRLNASAGEAGAVLTLRNADAAQPLQFALQVSADVPGCTVTLPDGGQLVCAGPLAKGQFILCRGTTASLTDNCRAKPHDLPLARPAMLARGESRLTVRFPGQAQPVGFTLVAWTAGTPRQVGR